MKEGFPQLAEQVVRDVEEKDLDMYRRNAQRMINRAQGSGTQIARNEAQSAIQRYWDELTRLKRNIDYTEFADF